MQHISPMRHNRQGVKRKLPGKEHEEEPGRGNGQDEDGFFRIPVPRQSTGDAGQGEKVRHEEYCFGWIVRLVDRNVNKVILIQKGQNYEKKKTS